MKTRSLTLLLLCLVASAPAQTVVRLSNLVEVAYFTNDDRMIVYRGTNPPYVLRGSNMLTTLRQFFLTNADVFQPATANGTNWSAISTNALTSKFDSNAVFAQKIYGAGTTTVSSNNGIYTITSAGGSVGGGAGNVVVSHPITGQIVPAGGEWFYVNEAFKRWGAAAWPAEGPLVISGTSAYNYRAMTEPEVTERRGGLWLWVTNWPARLTYLYWSANTTTSGSGSMKLRTNSWYDASFRLMDGGHDGAITNLEVIAGLVDAPAISAGTASRDGAWWVRRPVGGTNTWAAVVWKANAMVSSNSLAWGSGTNEWVRLSIYGSSNSLTFATNGVAAVTVNSLTFATNWFFPVMYLRSVVTNTGSSRHSNSVWLDWITVKE